MTTLREAANRVIAEWLAGASTAYMEQGFEELRKALLAAEPAQPSKYSDIVSDGGMDPREQMTTLREALLGVMPMVERYVDCNHDTNECANVKARDAARAALAAEQPQSEWKLVSDEKPPEGIPVWLNQDGVIWVGTFEYEDDGWHFTRCYQIPIFGSDTGLWSSEDSEWDDDYAPTHWMPLPAAPEVK